MFQSNCRLRLLPSLSFHTFLVMYKAYPFSQSFLEIRRGVGKIRTDETENRMYLTTFEVITSITKSLPTK